MSWWCYTTTLKTQDLSFYPWEDVAVLRTTLLYTGEEETEVYT